MFFRAAHALALLLILNGSGFGQTEELEVPPGPHEFSLSLGYAHPFEDDAFKTRAPVRVPGGLAVDLTYVHDLEPGLGVGIAVHGYAARTAQIELTDSDGNPLNAGYTITPVSFSLLGRLSARRGLARPFVFVSGGLCVGGITESALGELRLLGFSYSFGGGLRFPIGDGIALSLHAVASGARVSWEQRPFLDSASDRYDAGYVAVLAGVAVTPGDLWDGGSQGSGD